MRNDEIIAEAMTEAAKRFVADPKYPDEKKLYGDLQDAFVDGARFTLNKMIVSADMVSRALQGFDTGTGDPNDYRSRMRAALEAAIQPNN
jgi:hypothetical protein